MDNDLLQKKIGETARKVREDLGLTQEQVGEKSGMSGQVYGRIERGGMMPSVPTFRRMAVALGTDPAKLLAMSPEEMPMSDSDLPSDVKVAVGLLRTWPASKVKVAVELLRVLDTARMRDD